MIVSCLSMSHVEKLTKLRQQLPTKLLSVDFEDSSSNFKPAHNHAIAKNLNEYHLPPPPGRRWTKHLLRESTRTSPLTGEAHKSINRPV